MPGPLNGKYKPSQTIHLPKADEPPRSRPVQDDVANLCQLRAVNALPYAPWSPALVAHRVTSVTIFSAFAGLICQ
jgi:hypothetical protein